MKNEINNQVRFTGTICSDVTFSHTVYCEDFYSFCISVERLSGSADVLPVIISKRLLRDDCLHREKVTIEGQLRSYNMVCDGKSRLVLKIFARALYPCDCDIQDENTVFLGGYLCKPPIYRTTPFCREIADLLLAVNRSYGKSDYIPCICWGRNARYCGNMEVSQFIAVSGRLQSRQYEKHLPDGTIEKRTAYEVSVNRLSIDPDAIEKWVSPS